MTYQIYEVSMRHLTFLLFIFLAACVTKTPVEYQFATSRFQTPFTSGSFLSGNIGLSGGPAAKYTLIRDISRTPPDKTTDIDDGIGLLGSNLYWSLGLYDWIDIYSSQNDPGIKIQILGNHSSSGWQMSIAGTQETNKTIITEYTSSDASQTIASANTDITTSDYGLSVGYKFEDGSTPYLSLGHRALSGKTIITQGNTKYNYLRSGKQDSIAIGAAKQLEHLLFAVELNYSDFSLTETKNQKVSGLGILFAYKW